MYFRQKAHLIKTKRIYLPIKWTAYQIQADYGHNEQKMLALKRYCGSLGKSGEKYFSIVQYDDGALHKVKNCLMFGAGGVGDIAIPLVTDCHQRKWLDKKYFAVFLGSIPTHPIRKQMFEELNGKNEFWIEDVRTTKNATARFAEVTEQSIFTLCPRGYGRTSFRLYEAMQLGSIPVYISDEHWLPFENVLNWEKFCVIVKPDEIKKIPEILKDIRNRGQCERMALAATEAYNNFFCYQSTIKMIHEFLESEK